MTKISKNIKQFRSDCGLTQDSLAEILSVSRQTVSSWETDRTQPDIDMLSALSKAFGVSEEELIYGKKNKVGLEPDKKTNRNVFFIVLTVFGTLLTVAGIVLLFAEFWDKLQYAKNLFALLPLLSGFGLAFFATVKRKDSAVWREASAVAWVVGMGVTNFLFNSLNSIDMSVPVLLLFCGILCLPILYIMKAVFPFVAYLGSISYSLAVLRSYNGSVADILLVCLNLAFLAVAFVWYKKNRDKSLRDIIFFWTLLASVGFAFVDAFFSFGYKVRSDSVLFIALVSFALGLYVFSPLFKPRSVDKFSALWLCGMSLSSVIAPVSRLVGTRSLTKTLCCVIVGLTFVFVLLRLPKLIKEPLSLGVAVIILLELVITLAFGFADKENLIVNAVFTVLLGIVFIIKGVSTAKLSTANLGMVTSGAVAVFLLFASDLPPVAVGTVITICGVTLLVVNKLMYKKFSEKKEGESQNG